MDRYQAMATFVRVVETGSFSAAARHLNVGQPAVSKTIAQLEGRLQVSLLIRSTHGLTPTEAGQRFYERARAAIQEADEAELAARGAGAGLSGCLRVSAATTFARLHIVPMLPRFLAQHPGLEIDVILDDRIIDLVVEGIDVSLRMGELSDSSAVARKLATGGRSVLATPAYLERAGEPHGPADLAGHEAVIYSQLPNVWSFTRDGAEASVSVRGRVRVSAAEGLRAAVLADMGLTIASDWMFAPELASGAVRRVLQDWTLPPLDLWAVFPAGRMASAKAREFASFVEGVMARAYSRGA
ncbi:LysR family transcriptional regulator [Bradyrhizobium sp. 83012]|uniref:LysR family transcriptional regulator n=1 Tax=Bradyrhizobium aeschynomenes TaxID=2734909 RepID=A0ABX2CM73_9BRAD|nr:LysR family transcriptional regulator [Bradyrhizobium aeschynomenes]NPU12657.1 LysR family transcriptional regulator [Bradyrhizobium aeschynomenes]NPU69266.1 LysR family transcriptional regulator [Bradyrhizobium aeschynomenes]NPV25545.1 LysR family transcriptional regulator [Bradyrhizobium aeschynomenes]